METAASPSGERSTSRGVGLPAETAVLVNGRRTLVPAKIVQREVAAQREGIVAEYSGEWHDGGPWALEAVVVTDRGEKIASRLRVDNPRGGGR